MASLNDRIAAGTVDEITTPAAGQRAAVSEDGDPNDKYIDLSKFAAIAGGSDANFAAMPQVGGNPIVERGSNSDGEWVRFADGTQIAAGTAEGISATAQDNSPIHFSSSNNFKDFPVSFTECHYTNGGAVSGGAVQWVRVNENSNQWEFRLMSDRERLDTDVQLIAIGRWF